MSDTERESPDNRWGAPLADDGLVHLQDHGFDYEDYFDRFRADTMSDDEKRDFPARVYGMFCRDVFISGGDMSKVSFWAANYVAEKLHQVLGGVPWGDIMSLPWDEPTPYLTPKGQRALDIFAHVENTLHKQPDANVTDLLSQAASKHHVSYETARADYYAMKKGIKGKTGIPSKFLISGADY